MQQVYIPHDRVKKMRDNKAILARVERLCNCRISIDSEDTIQIEGEAFPEFSAKNIVFAFGRGFDLDTACKLAGNDYYFTTVDLEQVFGSEKRISQVKARIIGENGRTKKYIESVSLAKISVYGNTVSFIGTIEEIGEAQAAVDTLIEGGTHRLAYSRMEAAHRKNRTEAAKAAF